MTWISTLLEILKNLTTCLNRETSAEENLKDEAIKLSKNHTKAVKIARKIFDGTTSKIKNKVQFEGLDSLLPKVLDEENLSHYRKLRAEFNKYE